MIMRHFPQFSKQPNTTTTLVIVCKKLFSSHHAHYKQGGTSRSTIEEFSLEARRRFDPNPSLNTFKSSKIAKVELQIEYIMSGINKHV
jgi:hypothetical protein